MARRKPKAESDTQVPPVIELVNLRKEYGHRDTVVSAINGVSLTIQKGEFVAIMGPSGCGKTTLLNILGLLDSSTDGEYALDGRPVHELSARKQAQIRSKQIGFVFQSFNLIARMNVIENVALPLTYRGSLRYKNLSAASKMLKTFELQEREYYQPHQLSGGQPQRVAIARALVNTIVMVTHNPDLTVYATRIIHMKDGKIATDTARKKPRKKPGAKRALGSNLSKAVKKAKETSS